MADIFGWYDDLLANRYAPQTSPMSPAQPEQPQMARWQDGQLQPYQPSNANTQEAYNQAWGMTGIPDMQQAYRAYQRGEYLPALGQGAYGAATLAGNVAPLVGGALRAAPAIGRAAAPVMRDVLPALQGVLADESGALRLSQAQRARRMLPPVAEGPAPAGAAPAAEPALEAGPSMLGHNRPPAEAPPALGFPQNYTQYGAAKFPQYAEAYPEVGPPTPTLKDIKDPSKGTFDAKTPTPEAAVFVKERNKIMADMKKKGYTPYFDPEARYYVDPSNYPPPNVDTSTVGVKKPDAVARYAAVIDKPETKQNIRDAYARGIDLGNAEHWYAMGQLEKAYTDELGLDAGRKAYLDEFAVPLSATTSGNKPINNFLMAHYMEYLRKNNLPAPEQGHQLPYPIGGRRPTTNLEDYARMRAKGGYAGLAAGQPKMHDFARSNIGDLSHAVIDEQMAGGSLAHTPGWGDKARTGAYGQVQRPVHEVTAEMNVERARQGLPPLLPGNVQDVAWTGFKNEGPGQPLISVINDSIERTHRLTGMPREEIVRRGLVRKEIPMYGLLGAIGAGTAANQY